MVQSTGSVRFDTAEPGVFHYSPFQYNYEQKNQSKRPNLPELDKNKGLEAALDDLIYEDSLEELGFCGLSVGADGTGEAAENGTENAENADISTQPLPCSSHNGPPAAGSDGEPAADRTQADAACQDQNGGNADNTGEKLSNATYFYRILHHLINISSDGSRFGCCARSPARACESCRVIERLIFTYFDLTTLDDVIEERAKRGICGHMYCNNKTQKSGNTARYKIDVVSKNIYKREEFELFCSVLCLEENEKVVRKMAASPVETGAFTPRAMRCANNEALKTLHDDLFSLPECSPATTTSELGHNFVTVPARAGEGAAAAEKADVATLIAAKAQLAQAPDAAKNAARKHRIDTFEIYEDFDSHESLSDSSVSEVNVKFDKNGKKPISIYKGSAEPSPRSDDGGSARGKNGRTEDPLEESGLGVFSVLWYLLSNIVTDATRALVNSGVAHFGRIHVSARQRPQDQFETLYSHCLSDVPDALVATMGLHVRHVLATFKPMKSNALSNKIVEPLSYIVKYAVLANRHHLPLSYNIRPSAGEDDAENSPERLDERERLNSIEEYERDNEEIREAEYQLLSESVRRVLTNRYMLDTDSINILMELFVEL